MRGFEQELAQAGFSGHLTKPVDLDALLAEMGARLGGERLAAGPAPRAATAAAAGADGPPLVSRLAAHPKLGRIVARFVEQLPGKLAEMEATLPASDWRELAALAHWLKGAGGSMGFDDLTEPALALERAAQTGDPGEARRALRDIRGVAARIRSGTEIADMTMLESAG
jgi:HPt (histidine-containing phosphotransfer) domain-containing protein